MIELAIVVMGLWVYKGVETCEAADAKLLLISIAILIAECLITRIYEIFMKVSTNFMRVSFLLIGVGRGI